MTPCFHGLFEFLSFYFELIGNGLSSTAFKSTTMVGANNGKFLKGKSDVFSATKEDKNDSTLKSNHESDSKTEEGNYRTL